MQILRCKQVVVALFVLPILMACGAEKNSKRSRLGKSIGLTQAGCYSPQTAPSLGLVGTASSEEFPDTVLDAVRRDLPSGVEVEPLERTVDALAEHYSFRYKVRDVYLCDQSVQVDVINDRIFVSSQLPKMLLTENVANADLAWKDPEDLLPHIANELDSEIDSVVLASAERCLVATDESLTPAWEAHVEVDGREILVYGNGSWLHRVDRDDFHVTAEAKIYDKNPVESELKTAVIEVDGSGNLATSRLTTILPEGYPRAFSPEGRFIYESEDPKLAEVNAFAHASKMLQWLGSPAIGMLPDCEPVELHLHELIRDSSGKLTKNNATYRGPSETKTGRAEIVIGDGDGKGLQSLPFDFDVVAHELGHHVVFRKLTAKNGVSRVIHEGLADYLVAAKTNNACIGESICPENGGMCATSFTFEDSTPAKRCLRNGDNELNLKTPGLPNDTYSHSQVIFGLLWQIAKEKDLGHDRMATLVVRAVDFLLPTSQYKDLVKALMTADHALHEGANACTILKLAKSRGLTEAVNDLKCEDFQ